MKPSVSPNFLGAMATGLNQTVPQTGNATPGMKDDNKLLAMKKSIDQNQLKVQEGKTNGSTYNE